MCSVIMQNGEIIGVDADDYMFNEKTRLIRLFKNKRESAKFNIDKIAGVVLSNSNLILGGKKWSDKINTIKKAQYRYV